MVALLLNHTGVEQLAVFILCGSETLKHKFTGEY
jgi:hypothetical protein